MLVIMCSKVQDKKLSSFHFVL